ncbi:tetratricopeptide repeat protein [candidate division WOR-3 bacterium]|nr:tetratricopeptide repeat protein [candidate division WOR-3 bacterium]
MIYILLLLTTTQNNTEIRKITPLGNKEPVIRLIKEKKYEEALRMSKNPGIKGRIKILNNETFDGFLDIKRSALKGNIPSCNLFILSKMDVPLNDITLFIQREFQFDSTTAVSSPYTEYLLYPLTGISNSLSGVDSLLVPFIIYRLGEINLKGSPEKAKEYFNQLIREYPKSIPAIIARNLIRVIKEKPSPSSQF